MSILQLYNLLIIFEQSDLRGTGMVLRMASGLHLNMSGAFFHTLNDLVRSAQVEGAANRGDFSVRKNDYD